MIPEWKTNYLYFSELLPEKYPEIFSQIEKILKKEKIKFDLLLNTKDIWCRDYMPVQINENEFVQFEFNPDYLKNYEKLKTNPWLVTSLLKINCKKSEIILDGGNIVYSTNFAFVTDKIFSENRKKINLIQKLQEELQVEKVFVFPKQPYDIYGHIDSMVRFIDEKTILINDFSYESRKFNKKLKEALEKVPFKIYKIKLPFYNKFSWIYLNYIHVGKLIIIPIIGIEQEEKIISQFKNFFPEHSIYTLNANKLYKKGGALHCISWNLLKS